jgi:ubiquitin-like 1-activating enzyme E1 B
VFNEDINRLLKMEEMWKVAGRVKPVALDVTTINDGSFVTPPLRNAPPVQAPAEAGPGHTASNGAGPSKPAASQATLKDQRELSVKDNLDLFVDR